MHSSSMVHDKLSVGVASKNKSIAPARDIQLGDPILPIKLFLFCSVEMFENIYVETCFVPYGDAGGQNMIFAV